MPAIKIIVGIPGQQNYCVRIGSGLLDGLGEVCQQIECLQKCPYVLVVTDSNVAPLYLDVVKKSFSAVGYKVSDIIVPAGENTKCVQVLSEIWEAMARLGLNRDSFVVALGGGVIGDLAGFAASTYMRGLPIVQVPTTLLSMVDSSVGGKTGINLETGKNMIGAFKQPSYVCASVDTLQTLDVREWQCGCGEIVKSAVIDSDDFFLWLADNASALAARDKSVIEEAIKRCVVFKADVVAQDQLENCGIRECLNYGHTLAHAIEKLAGYGQYSHGAAVAEGMRFAAFLGVCLGQTNEDFVKAQADILDILGLTSLDWSAQPEEILQTMKHDKKARAGQVRFVIPHSLADWSIEDVADEVILQALKDYYE